MKGGKGVVWGDKFVQHVHAGRNLIFEENKGYLFYLLQVHGIGTYFKTPLKTRIELNYGTSIRHHYPANKRVKVLKGRPNIDIGTKKWDEMKKRPG